MGRSPRPLAAVVLALVLFSHVLAACGGGAPDADATADDPGTGARAPAAVTGGPSPLASPPPASHAPPPTAADPRSPTRAEVLRLEAVVAADRADPDAQRELGLARLQLVRETLDPTLYAAAETALREADRLRPDDPRTLVGIGGLLLGRHEFEAALDVGRRAVALAPGLAAAHGVVVDALVELGRYDEAEDAAGRMLGADDDLGSLARVSYLRELHGDLDAARVTMAAAAGTRGLAPENEAFALSVLGNLERWTGDPAAARATWERALQLVPGHPPSQAGLARIAIGEGDLAEAERRFAQAADVVPLPEYVIALGEVQAARGDAQAAADSFALAAAEIGLFRANGVTVDLDLALFEADHGDPARALDLAEAAYAATPTTRAADAVAWALHRLGRDDDARPWSRRALRLGSRDPLLRFHAGAIEAARGRDDAARADLAAALAMDPGFSATGAAEARDLLASLGD